MSISVRSFTLFCLIFVFMTLYRPTSAAVPYKRINVPTNTQTTLFHPRFVRSVDGATSALYIRNQGSATATIVVTFYSGNGAIEAQTHDVVSTNAVLAYDPPPAFVAEGFEGSVVVSSDQPISSIAYERAADGSVAAYSGVREGANRQHIGPFYHTDNRYSSLWIMNTGAAATTVTVNYSGNNIFTSAGTIQPGSAIQFIGETFLPDGYVGTATVTADGGGEITGLVVQTAVSSSQKSIHLGQPEGSTTTFMPSLFKSADLIGEHARTSELLFYNPTNTDAFVNLIFYTDDGLIMATSDIFLESAANHHLNLDDMVTLLDGVYSLVVTSNEAIIVSDVTLYKSQIPSTVAEYDGFRDENGRVTLPRLLHEEDHFSVVTIQNVGAEATTAVFAQYLPSGVQLPIEDVTVTIQPGASAIVTDLQGDSSIIHSSNGPIITRVAEYQTRTTGACQPITNVSIEPPEHFQAGVPALITAVSNGSELKAYQWTVNGEANISPFMALLETIETAGQHTIGVAVSNACSAASGSLNVTVTEPAFRYVSLDSDCGGAAPCYPSLQEAIAQANDNDVLKVAGGTYTGFGTRVITIDKPLTLLGGYSSSNWETADPTSFPTIIDGEESFQRDNVFIDVGEEQMVHLHHLTIQNGGDGINVNRGHLQLTKSDLQNQRGSGVYLLNEGTSQIIENNIQNSRGYGIYAAACFQEFIAINNTLAGHRESGVGAGSNCGTVYLANNIARENGVGVALFSDTPKATVINNQMISNRVIGLSIYHVLDATVQANLIQGNGSGVGLNDVADVLFTENRVSDAHDYRLFAVSGSQGCKTIQKNDFVNNTVSYGLLHLENTGPCFVSFNQNTVVGNQIENPRYYRHATLYLDDARVKGENNIIGNNEPFETAVYLNSATLLADHWTIADKTELGVLAEASMATFSNSILSGQTAAAFVGDGISAEHTLFHIQGATCINGAVCTNNIDGDPHFVNPDAGNYHIQRASAAFNQADSLLERDIDGDERPFCGGTDLGADEYVSGLSLTGLHLAYSQQNNEIVDVVLSWPPLTAASTIEIRYASALITDDNWQQANVLAAGIAGIATSVAGEIPSTPGATYFALKYVDDCGESAVSQNVSWPVFKGYLPLIRK